ncbi:MAG: rhomboid family intramembrane serine protease [Vicinamibacterales bacterium]
MLGRKTSGSVVCASCGSLVGVNDDKCYSCGRANPGMWGFAPVIRRLGSDLGFVPMVITATTVLYALTLLVSGAGALRPTGNLLGFLSPTNDALLAFGASGGGPLFILGAWWSVLSATWLHGGLLHIFFNMYVLRGAGTSTVDIIGPGRTVIVYVVAGACGFLLSSVAYQYFPPVPFLMGARMTVGASGAIFGLVGALVHYGHKSGSRMIYSQASQWALMMFLFGLFMPGTDNYAHAGGFIGGYLTSAFMNPLTRERGDHLLIAGLCLLASAAAVAASFIQGWSYLFA